MRPVPNCIRRKICEDLLKGRSDGPALVVLLTVLSSSISSIVLDQATISRAPGTGFLKGMPSLLR